MLRDQEQTTQDSSGTMRSYACGKYRLVAELARGGMSIVYLAFDARQNHAPQLLVLKELRPELAADPALLAMFIEEGRLAAGLNHPNVVRTLGSDSDGEHHYIVMEHLDGQSLHALTARARKTDTPLPLELHCAVLCRALAGLAYAHEATDREGSPMWIVHRDVSPHNVFVDYAGRVKVLDFGIAKMAQSSVNTRTGILKGKVPYMSPEQAAGTVLDARSDVFALGIMMWEGLTGRRFWSGMTSETQILRALWQGNLSLESDGAMSRVPEALRAVIVRATELDPGRRYSGAREMLVDLRGALASSGVKLFDAAEIGKIARDLFVDERARVRAAIEEALASHKRGSGEYPVPELPPASRDPAVTSSPPVPFAAPPPEHAPEPPPAPDASPAGMPSRDALIAEAVDVERAVAGLQASERIASLPQSVESIARAVHAVGGAEPAVALEALSDCMQVVEDLNRWRVAAVEYLRHADVPAIVAVDAADDASIETFDRSPSRLLERPAVRLFAAAAAGVLVTSLGFSTLGRSPAHSTMASTLTSPVPPPGFARTVVAPTVERARPDVAHVIVRATPLGSRIVVDQQTVYDNPCVATLPKDGANHVVHVDAEGYVAEDHPFVASGDMTIILALQRKTPVRSIVGGRAASAPPTPNPVGPAGAPGSGAALAGKSVETCKSE